MDTEELNGARRAEADLSNVAVQDAPEMGRVVPPPPGTPVYPPPIGVALPPPNGGYSTPGAPVYVPAPQAGPPVAAPARRNSPLVLILVGLILLFIAVAVVFMTVALVTRSVVRQTPAVAVGPVTTESRSVPLGAATTAGVEIANGVGKLTLAGGAANLLDATFTYNVKEWQPEVNYQVRLPDNTGYLTVRQPSTKVVPVGDTRYEWDLRLNNDVPMNLKVALGVGEGLLKLGGLDLTRLEVDSGVGAATVDLNGAWSRDVPITIHGGVGSTRLILPRDTGVQVTAHGGLGQVRAAGFHVNGDTYTNDTFGKGPATLRIDVDLGVGDITLEQAK